MRGISPLLLSLAVTFPLGCSSSGLPNGADGSSPPADMAVPRDLARPVEDLAKERLDLAGCKPQGGECWQPTDCCSGYCAVPISRGSGPQPREGGPGVCVN